MGDDVDIMNTQPNSYPSAHGYIETMEVLICQNRKTACSQFGDIVAVADLIATAMKMFKKFDATGCSVAL